MGDEEKNHCKICFELKAKYMCPQCGISYCSTKCYRDDKHLNCSEAFYRRCVQEELQCQGLEPSSKENTQKMKEILKRYHENGDAPPPNMNEYLNNSDSEEEQVPEEEEDEELDSDDDEDLEKRLADIDLDDSEEVWGKLTAEEREDFLKMVRANEGQGIEPVAEPWHPGMTSKKLVEELQNDDEEPS